MEQDHESVMAHHGMLPYNAAMRTTLDLDEAKIRELMRLLDVRSKTEAIELAVDECLRSRRRSRLRSLAGRIQLAEDWRELRDTEKDA